jgi:hypothetical protein
MFHNSFLHPTEKAVEERRSGLRQLLNEKLHFEKCADAEFTPDDFDRLFEFQIYSRNPKQLSSDTLYALDVSIYEDCTQRAFYKLLKEGYLIESPSPDIDVEKITGSGKFRHHFGYLTEYGQKRLACILLAWKREIARLKFLEEELEKVEASMKDFEKDGKEIPAEVVQRSKDVKKEMKLKPTARIQKTA